MPERASSGMAALPQAGGGPVFAMRSARNDWICEQKENAWGKV